MNPYSIKAAEARAQARAARIAGDIAAAKSHERTARFNERMAKQHAAAFAIVDKANGSLLAKLQNAM